MVFKKERRAVLGRTLSQSKDRKSAREDQQESTGCRNAARRCVSTSGDRRADWKTSRRTEENSITDFCRYFSYRTNASKAARWEQHAVNQHFEVSWTIKGRGQSNTATKSGSRWINRLKDRCDVR